MLTHKQTVSFDDGQMKFLRKMAKKNKVTVAAAVRGVVDIAIMQASPGSLSRMIPPDLMAVLMMPNKADAILKEIKNVK